MRHDPNAKTQTKYEIPALGTDTEELKRAAEDGRLLRLHTTKLSWAARPMEPQWLVREGLGGFRVLHVPQMTGSERRELRQRVDARRVLEYVRQRLALGVKLSQSQLTNAHSDYGMSRDRARELG